MRLEEEHSKSKEREDAGSLGVVNEEVEEEQEKIRNTRWEEVSNWGGE